MRLNEVEGFETDAFILAKFTLNEYVDDFINGNLFMNNFNHFINQEKESKHKGQGDSFEAALVTEVKNIRIIESETNQIIATANNGNLIERYDYFRKTPLYCLALFATKDFKVLEHSEESIKFKLDIPEEDKAKFRNDFGSDTVAFTFNPEVFVERLITKDKEINGDLRYGMVNYTDYSIMESARRKAFEEGKADFLFTKHNSLSYQREFRIILPQLQSDKPFIFNIGNLGDIFSKVTIDQFLDECYIEMQFKKRHS